MSIHKYSSRTCNYVALSNKTFMFLVRKFYAGHRLRPVWFLYFSFSLNDVWRGKAAKQRTKVDRLSVRFSICWKSNWKSLNWLPFWALARAVPTFIQTFIHVNTHIYVLECVRRHNNRKSPWPRSKYVCFRRVRYDATFPTLNFSIRLYTLYYIPDNYILGYEVLSMYENLP